MSKDEFSLISCRRIIGKCCINVFRKVKNTFRKEWQVMLNSFDLNFLKNAAIADYSKDSLVDLHDVKIDPSKSVADKMNDYFEQIKNPYLFKVGDIRVKVSFGGERSFTDVLGSAILNGTNYQTYLG